MNCDLDELLWMGEWLDSQPDRPSGTNFATFMADRLLLVRGRNGRRCSLKANSAQLEFERRRGSHNIILKARQMGITTWITGRYFLKTIGNPGTLTVQVAHTRDAAEAIFGVAQRMWENLPPPLREGPLKRSRANIGQMVFEHLDSEFRVISAADENAGRGLTIQNLHISELSRWTGNAAETLAGLRAALAPGGEMTIESTPSGAYGAFYDEWQRADESELIRHFFPWWMEPAYVAKAACDLREDERELKRLHNLTPQQIGYRRILEQGFRTLRSQEYAEDAVSCFKASGECCFEIEPIEHRLASLSEPLTTKRSGALLTWFPAQTGRQYIVSVDTAGGGSEGDFACVQVVDKATGLQCAELRERLGTLELARVSAALAREYNQALIAVERNNHGAGVLAYLDSSERYAKVYEQQGVAGWLTSAGSKPAMVSRLGALVAEQPQIFYSARLLAECRTFITLANGRMGAANGAHDDCVMAMAIAQAVRVEKASKA